MAWVWRGRRRRARQWSALGQGGRLRGDGARGWLAAIVCLIVALAQPRWGRVPAPPLPPGRDVVLLVDTSRSMGAEDAVPDRLGVAVEAAVSLVEALGREAGNRVAVVAFAGRGVLRCPMTENLGAVVETLRALRPGDVRPGGTDLGAALTVSLDAFGAEEQAGGRTIVVFSDGEDHAGRRDATIERLGAAGIVVHAVAVGDAEHGHPVPSGRGKGSLSYQGAQKCFRGGPTSRSRHSPRQPAGRSYRSGWQPRTSEAFISAGSSRLPSRTAWRFARRSAPSGFPGSCSPRWGWGSPEAGPAGPGTRGSLDPDPSCAGWECLRFSAWGWGRARQRRA